MDTCLNCGRRISGPLERRAAGLGPHRPHAPENTTFKRPAAPDAPKPAPRAEPVLERRTAPRAPRPAEDAAPRPVVRRPSSVVERVAPRVAHDQVAATQQDWLAPAFETTGDRSARRSVIGTAVAAIAIGAVGLVVANLKHFGADTTAHRVGFEVALTTLVYACVAFLVLARLGRFSFRPRFAESTAARGITMGLVVGGIVALVLALANAAVAGHVTSDPRILGVLSEGNALAVIGILFIALVAAPFLEEFLFRGLLVESLRVKGRTLAVLGGAVAFSLWHLNPAALRYYVLMGFLFGGLYWRYGLAGSISAHVAFNGILTVFAFMALSSPAVLSGNNGVQATLPGGWNAAHIKNAPLNIDLAAESAGGAGLVIAHFDVPTGVAVPKADHVPLGAKNIRTTVVAGSNALTFDTTQGGHDVEIFLVGRGRRAYSVTFVPEHSAKATAQLNGILQSLTLPAA